MLLFNETANLLIIWGLIIFVYGLFVFLAPVYEYAFMTTLTIIMLFIVFYIFHNREIDKDNTTLLNKIGIKDNTPEPTVSLVKPVINTDIPVIHNLNSEVLYKPLEEINRNKINYPYKLLKGTYAKGVLYSGFNENIIYNNNKIKQNGGGTEEKPVININKINNAKKIIKPEHSNELHDFPEARKNNILYSGDIIFIYNGAKVFQRGVSDSEIVCGDPVKYTGTNLSKLRFTLKNHNVNKNQPIKYGDVVYLNHNIYYGNKNETRYIKHGKKLQSHQEGPLFNEYQIFDSTDILNRGEILLNKDILISKSDTTDDKKFLRVLPDNSITVDNLQKDASIFRLELLRVFEIGNRHLSINNNEILFP